MNRIAYIADRLRLITVLALVGLAAVILYITPMKAGVTVWEWYESGVPDLPGGQVALGTLLVVLASWAHWVPHFYMWLQIDRLLRLYGAGRLFEDDNARLLKRIGWTYIVVALLPGFETSGFDVTPIMEVSEIALLSGALFVLFGHVMVEANKAHEELEGVV